MSLINKLKKFLQTHSLVQAGDKVSLAVSGGLDSVALLHLFVQMKSEFKMQLNIVHVNHGMRPEADSDEIFVKDLAEEYNLGFYSTKVDAGAYAKQNKFSLEESARELRYKFFEEILHKTLFDKLATAHTANDQAETVLDHFLRGSGISGLRGMSEKRGPYIRPFLSISRQELQEYVEQNRLSYRQDKTNNDTNFKRNRIRHELIPLLQENFNPNLIGILNRTSEIFRATEQFLQEYAADACKTLISVKNKNEIILEIDGFLNYNNLIKKYILFNCCSLLLINRSHLNYHKLNEILELIDKRQIGKKTAINRDFDVIIDHDGLVIT